jgi:CubicO group peptidase (beta-lactamase class C family)
MILRSRTNRETEQIQAAAARIAEAPKIPAVSVAIALPDGTVHGAATGQADLAAGRAASVDDQYPWFSMTKVATATAAMVLHARGDLDLDAPIGTYLAAAWPGSKHGHPTTRQLLTHTAGLSNPLPIRWVRLAGEPEDRAQIDRILERHGTPTRAIPAQARYSNIGYLLAADVMQAITGRTIQDCVTEHVLQPLGMHDTGYDFDPSLPRAVGYVRLPRPLAPLLRRALPDGIVGDRIAGRTALRPFLVSGAGYGGLIGPVTDAIKLAAAHAQGTGLAHEPMHAITNRGKPFDHGIAWFRRPADAGRDPAFVEHYGTGGGFWNAMRIYPDLGLAMVAMANTTSKWDVDRLFTELAHLMHP